MGKQQVEMESKMEKEMVLMEVASSRWIWEPNTTSNSK